MNLPGELRAMTVHDGDEVAALLNDIFRHRHGVFDQDVITDFPLVFVESNYRNCRVIEVDGAVVSHSAIFPNELVIHGRRHKTAMITLVATLQEHRRRGHADRIMRDLQRTMSEEQYDLGILWTGVPKFYQQLGWETVTPEGWMIEDLLCEDLSSLESYASDDSLRVEPYRESAHLAGIIGLHDLEPVRIARSKSEYAALVQLPKVQTWVLMRDQKVLAYACIGQARNKHGVIEYGGETGCVAQLIGKVIEENRFSGPLKMLLFPTHPDLADRFGDTGAAITPLKSSKGRGTEMIFVVDGAEFPEKARKELFVWGLDTA